MHWLILGSIHSDKIRVLSLRAFVPCRWWAVGTTLVGTLPAHLNLSSYTLLSASPTEPPAPSPPPPHTHPPRWIPEMVLRMSVVLMSLGWACLVFFLTLPAVRNNADKW